MKCKLENSCRDFIYFIKVKKKYELQAANTYFTSDFLCQKCTLHLKETIGSDSNPYFILQKENTPSILLYIFLTLELQLQETNIENMYEESEEEDEIVIENVDLQNKLKIKRNRIPR